MKKDELNQLYHESCSLIMPYIRLEGSVQQDINSPQGQEAVRKGIEGLTSVLRFSHESWPSHWMLGKVYQALNNHEEAYKHFLASHKLALTEQDVMRELGLECLHTKRFDEAAYYANAAHEFQPEDYTLWSNLAACQLFLGKLDDAERWAKKALAKMPDDEPAKNVLKLVQEIRDGKRGIPSDFNMIEREECDRQG